MIDEDTTLYQPDSTKYVQYAQYCRTCIIVYCIFKRVSCTVASKPNDMCLKITFNPFPNLNKCVQRDVFFFVCECYCFLLIKIAD